ncbi:hypothetical protein MLP_47900 [Microlunatus phosphovorus NM-1]|uniref:Uncharacterized protein n=1 Tax=Microlunatus phosphovorus (strain ATCC 700054 / DSM 10555 / JCM 9379 / NBRC 101784 / NCIMB 13414 / VKM Ac-1990 / NM-1) TaxID=1032480 RepID=F5XF66_MICPN|nr:hypothetical protein MLP_47900 [Microlunatus phosphovorus NM-1]
MHGIRLAPPGHQRSLTACTAYLSRRRATDDHHLRVHGVRFAPRGHGRPSTARARRTSRAAGPPTIADRACEAYLSRRRATNQRRSGDLWLCRVGSLIEKEERHLFTAETGARTPSRDHRRRRGLACTRLYRRPPRSRIDFAPFAGTAHQACLMRSSSRWCEVGISPCEMVSARGRVTPVTSDAMLDRSRSWLSVQVPAICGPRAQNVRPPYGTSGRLWPAGARRSGTPRGPWSSVTRRRKTSRHSPRPVAIRDPQARNVPALPETGGHPWPAGAKRLRHPRDRRSSVVGSSAPAYCAPAPNCG